MPFGLLVSDGVEQIWCHCIQVNGDKRTLSLCRLFLIIKSPSTIKGFLKTESYILIVTRYDCCDECQSFIGKDTTLPDYILNRHSDLLAVQFMSSLLMVDATHFDAAK
jgi:hypothetical protein